MNVRIPTDLENAVVGGILLCPDALVDLDWLECDHFITPSAVAAWRAIRNLEAVGAPIDFVTVLEEVSKYGEGAAERAQAFLGECIRNVPDVTRTRTYATQLRDVAIERRVRTELTAIVQTPGTGAELLSRAMAVISKLDSGIPSATPTIGDVVKRRLKELEQIARDRIEGRTTMTGFPTGIASLDEKLGGWQAKIVSIVAARPAMGKSSLGLATADASSAAGFGVHLFSLEDTEEAYADRTLSRCSEVPANDMRNATMTRQQLGDMSMAIAKVMKRRWLVDSRSGVTADEIVRSVRKHKRENNTKVVIVDYVQLVKPTGGHNRHEQLTEIITTLADAAKHDGVAYVVMSQLNRDIEKRNDKRPLLSDLRESGSLEERSKCVVGIYRGHYYSPTPIEGVDYDEGGRPPDQHDYERAVQLLVLKNNNGRTGSAPATFHGPTTRMQ